MNDSENGCSGARTISAEGDGHGRRDFGMQHGRLAVGIGCGEVDLSVHDGGVGACGRFVKRPREVRVGEGQATQREDGGGTGIAQTFGEFARRRC